MKWEMEILSPSSYMSNTSAWVLEQSSRGTKWTPAENKLFENALAIYDEDTPDRWYKVAAMIPGKTIGDVIKQYEQLEADVSDIEAGLIPIPGYAATSTSPFTLDWVSSCGSDGFKQSHGPGKRSLSGGRAAEQERKKGIPWTEEEHKLFLLGLKKYGKGDWRNISRNYVITRTPTQVASHAQKYFIRQHSGGKDKRRASIHDITTVNLTDTASSPSEDKIVSLSQQQQLSSNAAPKAQFQWNQSNARVTMDTNPSHMSPYDSYAVKMQGQILETNSGLHESYLGSHTRDMLFQMPSYPRG